LEKAAKHFEIAVDIEPTEWTAHYNLSQVYTKLDKPELANRHLENVAQLTPDALNYLQECARQKK